MIGNERDKTFCNPPKNLYYNNENLHPPDFDAPLLPIRFFILLFYQRVIAVSILVTRLTRYPCLRPYREMEPVKQLEKDKLNHKRLPQVLSRVIVFHLL